MKYIIILLIISCIFLVYLGRNDVISNFIPGIFGLSKNKTEQDYNNFIYFIDSFKKTDKNIFEKKDKINYVKFIPNTIDTKQRLILGQIIGKIIPILNNNGTYDFHFTNYNDIKIYFNNLRTRYNYKIDCSFFDKKRYSECRLLIDIFIVSKPDLRVIKLDKARESNLPYVYFPLGDFNEDQMIPLAIDVIPTGGIVLSEKSKEPLKGLDMLYLHINSITLINSTDVYNAYQCLNNVNNINKEINIEKQERPEKSVVRNKLKIKECKPKNMKQFPCIPVSDYWDAYGVYCDNRKPTEECFGKNWATEEYPLTPMSNPTITGLPRNTGPNYWLFDLTKGIPSFPHGSSNSG